MRTARFVTYLRLAELMFAMMAIILWTALPFPPSPGTRVPSMFLGVSAIVALHQVLVWRRPFRATWWAAALLAIGVLGSLLIGLTGRLVQQSGLTWPRSIPEQVALAFLCCFYGSQMVVGVLLSRMQGVRRQRRPQVDLGEAVI